MKRKIILYLLLFSGLISNVQSTNTNSIKTNSNSRVAEGNIMNNPSFEEVDNLPEKITKHPKVGENTGHWKLLTSGVPAAGTVEVADDEFADGNKSMKVNLVDIANHLHFYLTYDIENLEPGIYEYSFAVKASVAGGLFKHRAIAFSATGDTEFDTDKSQKKDILTKAETTTTGWTVFTYKIDLSSYSEPIKLFRLDIRPNSNMNEKVDGSPRPISYWFDDFYFGGTREKKDIASITLGEKLQGGISLIKGSRLNLLEDDSYFSILPKQASKDDVVYTAADPAIVEVVNGELFAKSVGNTQITLSSSTNATIKSIPFDVTVTADDRSRPEMYMGSVSSFNKSKYTVSQLNANVPKWTALMNTAGEFTDINYADKSKTNWEPIKHVDRLSDLVFAYSIQGTAHTGSDELYDKIVAGFEAWVAKDPNIVTVNFWYNRIDVPKKIGVALIEMRNAKKQLPTALENSVLATLAAHGGTLPDGRTGANLIDMSVAHFLRACLQNNEVAMDKALEFAYSTLEVKNMYDAAGKNQEGIHHDGSFQQHGPQVYIGGYGDELIKGIVDLALYTETSSSLKGEPLTVFSDFVRNSYLGHIRGSNIHYNVIGRGVSRYNALIKTATNSYIKQMPFIDPTYATEYVAAAKRIDKEEVASYNIEPINKMYPIADYAVHTQKDYSFVVRGVSNRTTHIERGNGENEKGYFMTFGSTSLMTSGEEYLNIFPVWNWTRIPGVTSPQLATLPQRPVNWGLVNGTDTFVGGVSDTKTTVFTYDFTDVIASKTTKAKKSWFIFENEIVALGAGVNSDEAVDINTTLEQSLLAGDVTVKQNGTETKLNKAEHSYASGLTWVHHNNVGYFFPEGGNVGLNNIEQSGKWVDINTNNTSTDEVKKDVFSLFFNHGKTPADATYAYVIAPNKADAAAMNYYPIENIKIWENTKKMQVVEHKGQNTWQFVFFEAGQFVNDNITIQVDKPCAIIVKGADTKRATLHVADPAQTKQAITVAAKMPAVSSSTMTKVFNFDNANDDTAGYTLTATMDEIVLDAPKVSNLLADTYVQNGGGKEKKFGGETDLLFRNGTTASDDYQSYLKASLADMQNIPEGKEISKVELSLYSIYSPGYGSEKKQLSWILNPVEDTTWDEMEMTYLNKPNHSDRIVASVLGVINSGTNEERTVKLDITEYAKEELAKGKNEIAMRLIQGGDASESYLVKVGSKDRNHAVFSPKLYVYTSDKIVDERTITLPATTGLVLTPAAGTHKVDVNGNFQFSFVLEENYELSTPRVLANGLELTAKNIDGQKYEYELKHVTENIDIKIDGLRKASFDAKISVQGIPQSDLSKPYYIDCADNSLTNLQIDIEALDWVYVNQPRSFSLDVSKPGSHFVTVEVGSSSTDIKESYTLEVVKRLENEKIVVNKFGYRLIANNNPKTNGNYSFTNFEWFKNGQMAASGSVYAEPDKGKLDENAVYHLGMVLQSAPEARMETCPQKVIVPQEKGINVYPTVLRSGETINIDADLPEGMNVDNMQVSIYSLSGTLERNINLKQKENQIATPTMSNTYVVHVTCGDIIEKVKIVVQ